MRKEEASKNRGKNFFIALFVILLITGVISGIVYFATESVKKNVDKSEICLLYTSDAADDQEVV